MAVHIMLGCLTCKQVIDLGKAYEPEGEILFSGVFSEQLSRRLSQEESYKYLWKFLFKHRHHELRLEWEWFWGADEYQEINDDLSVLDQPEAWEPYEEWEALKRRRALDA